MSQNELKIAQKWARYQMSGYQMSVNLCFLDVLIMTCATTNIDHFSSRLLPIVQWFHMKDIW